ncbi:MAG TPA: regulatory iron-sulfur-containing complex subunit RicT [Dehalococcoidia bacterium]|nr:regulatory iron-sulfur-containing complex subunit RicT [Dehalococcoidia bacterium]
MARTVGIRFRQAGKIFYYDAGDIELNVSNYVVVETAHGLSVGRVVIAPDQVITQEGVNSSELKPVLRIATPEDVERADQMKARATEAVIRAKGKVVERGLDMSVASGEFDLDGSQFTAYFTANERVDFRDLVRDLSRDLDARVQLLQVGDRDRAKLTDGVDICGERLCCSSWMTNFPSVSIRMAKEQDLPLNPQKISGVCGRLYCCLTFEYEDYRALRGTLPKVGSFLSTPAGEAKVIGIDFNHEMVKLMLIDNHEIVEVAAIDFQLQHGVTIRPMELVRKIEGPLRPISEGRETVPNRLPRQSRPRPGGPASAPERPERPGSPRQSRPEAPRAGGRPLPPNAGPVPPRAAVPPPATTPRPEGAEGVAGEGQRRRRRRRRGRGGAGGGQAAPGSEGGPAPSSE